MNVSTQRPRWVGMAIVGLLGALAMGCEKKKETPPEEPPPPPPVATVAPVTELAPLVEDAGIDAAPEPSATVKKGPGMSANQARAKQGCNALRSQAKTLGASPEANILLQAATVCDGAATQLNPNATGQAPEFAMVRTL